MATVKRFQKLTFRALALRRSESSIRSDEGLTLETTQQHSFVRNLPLYSCMFDGVIGCSHNHLYLGIKQGKALKIPRFFCFILNYSSRISPQFSERHPWAEKIHPQIGKYVHFPTIANILRLEDDYLCFK